MRKSHEEREQEALKKLVVAEARLQRAQESYNKAKLKYDKAKYGGSIRERIRRVCVEKGISYQAIGDRIGMSRQAVEEYINRSSHTPKRLAQIADVLGVSVIFLITGRCDHADL